MMSVVIALCLAYSVDIGGDNAAKILDLLYLAYLGLLDILLSTMLIIYGMKFDRCLTYQKQLLPRSRKTFSGCASLSSSSAASTSVEPEPRSCGEAEGQRGRLIAGSRACAGSSLRHAPQSRR